MYPKVDLVGVSLRPDTCGDANGLVLLAIYT